MEIEIHLDVEQAGRETGSLKECRFVKPDHTPTTTESHGKTPNTGFSFRVFRGIP